MAVAPAVNVIGFTGSVDQTAWARMSARMGISPYAVIAEDDLKVSATSGDRTILIKRTKPENSPAANTPPGGAIGWGVMCEFEADSTISLPLVTTTGSRWDMIVLRRNWTSKTCVIEVIQGGSTRALPAKNSNPGVIDDQPLALVEVRSGSTAIQNIVDLRTMVVNGRILVSDSIVLQYLNAVGTEIIQSDGTVVRNVSIGGTTKQVIVGSRTFSNDASILPRNNKHLQTGYPSTTNPTRSVGEITVPDPGYPYSLLVQFAFEFVEYGDRWDLQAITSNGHWMAQALGGAFASDSWASTLGSSSYRLATGFSPARHSGETKVNLRALHIGPWGNGGKGNPFLLGQYNSYFRVLQFPA